MSAIWLGMSDSYGTSDPRVHALRNQSKGDERYGYMCTMRVKWVNISKYLGPRDDVDCKRCVRYMQNHKIALPLIDVLKDDDGSP